MIWTYSDSRALRLSSVALVLTLGAARPLRAQCPDGTPPPCRPRRAVAPPPSPQLRQLTTSGRIQYASVSPDGRFLAYVEDSVLMVRSLSEGGRPVVVSRDAGRFARKL